MIKLGLTFFGGRGASSFLANNPYARMSVDSIQQTIDGYEGIKNRNMSWATKIKYSKGEIGYKAINRKITNARKQVENADKELSRLYPALDYARRRNRNLPF